MTRIRTLEFLPEIFQTPTNAQFLNATLDQLVNPPITERIQGYVGSKLGYGINPRDYYVTEPTKERTDYQLDPSVIFTKNNKTTANDFITYPGIINALKLENSLTQNNSELFESQFYSFNSFTDYDKLVNYNEYYWLPNGPPAVEVSSDTIFKTADFFIESEPSYYNIKEGNKEFKNPTLTLLRNGRYRFIVDQQTNFWIQTQPGTSGVTNVPPYYDTRDVFGVENNGLSEGIITFNVPDKTAQDNFLYPGLNNIDVVSTVPFSNINGKLLSQVQNIDGVTSLNGLRVLFYNTGILNEIGYVQNFYDETPFDRNTNSLVQPVVLYVASCTTTNLTLASGYDTTELIVGQTITFGSTALGGLIPGNVYYISEIVNSTQFRVSDTLNGLSLTLFNESGNMPCYVNQGLLEEGYYTEINSNFFRIEYVGDVDDPVIRLVNDGVIPINQRIVSKFGEEYIERSFYKSVAGDINLIPILTAPLDILYYQDGTNPDRVGIINLIDSNSTNTINVELDILGQKNYTSKNGVVFTNGLKIFFDGDVVPANYLQGEYYVEGVGTSINLVPVIRLTCPELFTQTQFLPYDDTPYDIGNYDSNLFVPLYQDYITINRNSLNLNPWSRSNRWFHAQVINDTATYNNDPTIVTRFATYDNKAKRPIIEFYPNLKLFETGTLETSPIDFIDFRSTDAFTEVAGQESYYPDVAVYTTNNVTISATTTNTTTITVPKSSVTGTFVLGQYVVDSLGVLPNNTYITSISSNNVNFVLTVVWEDPAVISLTSNDSIITTKIQPDGYALFPGANIIFANDNDIEIRKRVYQVAFSPVVSGPSLITLIPVPNLVLDINYNIIVLKGNDYEGKSFYFDGVDWLLGQQKNNINQPPLFDVFDKNGTSFSDNIIYPGTSFIGSKLFSYGIGSGVDDSILGFPLRYSSIENLGDISFDVSFNIDEFNYVELTNPITKKINTGYVHNYTNRTDYSRDLGWQTAIGPSLQYQVFEFNFFVNETANKFTCDIALSNDTTILWPKLQVFINNNWIQPSTYTVTTTNNTTTIVLNNTPVIDTVIEVLIYSDQVSKKSYYTIPINLSNNPFNADIETVQMGDLRLHYESIFINTPTIQGKIFGNNNYRDLGNLIPYGNKIIQNSASLVLPGVFLRKQNQSLFNSLQFNGQQYLNYKQLIIDTVNKLDLSQTFTPSVVLDSAIEIITKEKNNTQSFFYSDMLPSKASYITNTYYFRNDLNVTTYPLSKIYNFETANYNGVLVYLLREADNNLVEKLLIKDVDYTISTTAPTVSILFPLLDNDIVVVKEYNQTYGSFVPNTPTKLGIYPSFQPEIIYDTTYNNPTWFIKGHDGSYTKLYGTYDENLGLIDFRDQALFEFEKRIYNNLKLDGFIIPILPNQVIPGYFRQTDLTFEEFNEIYSFNFLNWVGQNRLDYTTQFYNTNNAYTYNYREQANKLDNKPLAQGNWRGLYEYFYDTSEPNISPWQMLGLTNKPSWWEDRYGPSPYTSDNLILWNDLANGINYNNGNPYVVTQAIRPQLLEIIPVNSNGELLDPFNVLLGGYDANLFQKNWIVGDTGPVELSYKRSSTFPFDLIKIYVLTQPANFFNLFVDVDRYRFSSEFGQYLVNNQNHLLINEIEVYGNGIAKTSYLNWIVDYEKQYGLNGTENITTLLNNLDVRLVYRMAGFSDKKFLQFFVEKGSPNDNNASLLIPDESYGLLLYDNQPENRVIYSSVIVQKSSFGWSVFGNSQDKAYFEILNPINDGNFESITIENLTVKVPVNYNNTKTVVPYGSVFYTPQQLSEFLNAYGANLTSQGLIFNVVENGLEINWRQLIGEYLYWAQTGWEEGSIITLNPTATELRINKPSEVVQPLTIHKNNFVLNQNLYPINLNNLSITREQTLFVVSTLNNGDALSYGQFNLSNLEHGVVFDNNTVFNDVIYDLITGLRQIRIYVRGTKSAEWQGTLNASGFILNQDNIVEWNKDIGYTKGVIVLYKNKYWTSLRKIEPSGIFNENDWKVTEYDEIQKGLLPNSSTRSYESTLYYNINKVNLEQDADLLSFSLIGYRPRDYLSLVDLSDITQVNVYKNFIKEKGTKNSLLAFKGSNLPQGGIDYDTYENWAIKIGEFGAVTNNNFVEFKLRQNLLTGTPSIVSLTNGVATQGAQQEVPLSSLFNYNRPLTDPNILLTIPSTNLSYTFPNAGYVNFNDVKMSSYFYNNLPTATNSAGSIVPISNFYVRNYVWLANFLEDWQVYSWESIGEVSSVIPNVSNTSIVRFTKPHNLTRLEPLSIINFNPDIDGYYVVLQVTNDYEVIINLGLVTTFPVLFGKGIGLRFVSQRVETTDQIDNLNLLNAEFIKNTVWVDNDYDGGWGVFQKSINYTYTNTLSQVGTNKLGTSVAYNDKAEYLVSDIDKISAANTIVVGETYQIQSLGTTDFTSCGASSNTVGTIFTATTVPSGTGTIIQGKVYRYQYNYISENYEITQELSGPKTYGKTIKYAGQMYYIADNSSTRPAIYIYNINDTTVDTNLKLNQIILAPNSQITNFGESIAISNDQNWLYVSDISNNPTNYRQNVYVYFRQNIPMVAGYFVIGETYEITELGTTNFTLIGAVDNKVGIIFVATGVGTGTGVANQISYKYSTVIDGSAYGNDFGKSLSTDYSGDTLLVGSPGKELNNLKNAGQSLIYQRTFQNIEVQLNSNQWIAQEFALGWRTDNLIKTAISFNSTNDFILLNNIDGISVNDPIIFSGTGITGSNIQSYITYYIGSIIGNNITIKTSRSTSDVVPINTIAGPLNVLAVVQTCPLNVMVNGVKVYDNNYGCILNKFYYSGSLRPGDIINIQDNQFTLTKVFTGINNERVGAHFGNSVGVNRQGSEFMIGSPFEIDSNNLEGKVYRYTNGGAKYGIIIGTTDCNVAAQREIFINGFLLTIPPGNAEVVANAIRTAGIPNITASNLNGKLVINVIDNNIALPNEKCVLYVTDTIVLIELGIELYTFTQLLSAPHDEGSTQFGYALKFNEFDSIVISAPVGSRYEATTFDFTDDLNFDNDTIFDNNATQFIDSYPNAGAVYMFDYLPTYNESVINPGKFIYAQSTNAINQVYGSLPYYGRSLDFNNYNVVIGSPDFNQGEFIIYNNSTRVKDWIAYRKSAPIVNTEKIQNIQIFDSTTNNTLINLDYFDPLQGTLLGVVRENLDYISNVDPAKYNSPDSSQLGLLWGKNQVGQIWFNTNNTKFINYHQNDNVYNGRYWGTVFPGSQPEMYSWIESSIPPDQYIGPGTVLDPTLYVVQVIINSTGSLIPIYYFWVRNTGIINVAAGKSLADTTLEQYILNPTSSGVSYVSTLLPNTFGLYNIENFLNGNNSVFHIGYLSGNNFELAHNEYTLIRSNFADDFLPGVPNFGSNQQPRSLYDRLLDSLSGVDENGAVVPNPFLPLAVQSGIQVRPRQSFFYDRFDALRNYLTYANVVIKQFPIVETKPFAFRDFLQLKNTETNIFAEGLEYDVTLYWEYINWWAPGYNDDTKAAFEVKYYADLSKLTVQPDTIVNVGYNYNGNRETYRYDGNNIWTRIGLENGTIQFKPTLYNYSLAKFGFGDNFYDTSVYDLYPSLETRYIIRALVERIYTEELLIFRNKSLILLFDYIQTETIESQNFLPWLMKTSLVDVSHTIRELYPYEVYRSDNQEFLEGYLNEVKPYHVVIKDYLLKYTGTEVYEGDISDFDLPSQYNKNIDKFVSPELVYTIPDNDYEYLPTSPIWENSNYSQWFNNRGLSLSGIENYSLTTLAAFVNIASTVIFLDNVSGIPVTGVIQIDNEYIGYSYVDRALNFIGNIQRGLYGTEVEDHIPGATVIVDLPGVVILNSGRGYISAPKVTAYLDPLLYPQPITQAVLVPVMSLDKVVAVDVIDPGLGYLAQPEIIIEPSSVTTFTSADIDTTFSTITIYAPSLVTGDLIQFIIEGDSSPIKGLKNKNWYYINVLETDPNYIFGLYYSYAEAINDDNRVKILSTGNGTYSLNLGAQAYAITTAQPKRENILTLKYDRTTYRPQVTDWTAGVYYGAFFAGVYSNSEKVSSSSIKLQSTLPPISKILASARGVVFEIDNIVNDQTVTYSSFVRYVSQTLAINNTLRLIPQDGNIDPLDTVPATASGLTLGFYPNMPIKFSGDVGPVIIQNQVYYVKDIFNDYEFTITETFNGSTLVLTNHTVSERCDCFVGEVTNTALVTVTYPDILNVTATTEGINKITIPLNSSGTGGTSNMYINIPVEFVGTSFGNIVTNFIYYVTTIIDEENFTISKNQNPVRTIVTGTSSTGNVVTVEDTNGFNLNDPIIFNEMKVISGSLIIGQTYKILELNGTDFTNLGATENIIGQEFVATGTGIYDADQTTQGLLYYITSLGNTNWNLLANTTGITYVVGDEVLIHNPTAVSGSTGKCAEGLGVTTTKYFGNIYSGRLYFVRDIINPTTFTIANVINGSEYILNDQVGTALVTNQNDVERLTTSTGTNLICNVSLPVSPGQVTGQLFNFYNTSRIFISPQLGPNENLITKTIPASLGNGTTSGQNKFPIEFTGTGLSNFYVNMPMEVNVDQGEATFDGALTIGLDGNGYLEVYPDSVIGKITIGGLVTGNGIVVGDNVRIVSIVTGTPGGAGTYLLNQAISNPVGTYTIEPNLNTTTTYYIINYSGRIDPSTNIVEPKLTANCTATVDTVNYIICDSTDQLYEGMPIVFSLFSLGGLLLDTEYYVKNIISPIEFTISNTRGGPITELSTQFGTMLATGQDWVQFSTTINGDSLVLSNSVDTTIATQTPQGSQPDFDISYILGGYRAIITAQGSGYAINNTITIQGVDIGGISPNNNLTLTINGIDSLGQITDVICSGKVPGLESGYFCEVYSGNQFYVYSNPLLTVPVSGIDFPYVGVTKTTATAYLATGTSSWTTDPVVQLTDSSGFVKGDAVNFTGSIIPATAEFEGSIVGTTLTVSTLTTGEILIGMELTGTDGIGNYIVPGTFIVSGSGSTWEVSISQTLASANFIASKYTVTNTITYYIIKISSLYNQIVISTEPSGTSSELGLGTGLMTMAKLGSTMFLPEPFYFNQSIVKFNNRVYSCVVSNNDSEFILGKWEEIRSDNIRLNALDRVAGFYQPTADMPGNDVTQLFEGVTYPNSTYFGNPFAPAQQYPLDTILKDTPFYPTQVNITSILYNGVNYFGSANVTDEYSAVITSLNGDDWGINKLSDVGINTTDIIFGDNTYVMTSRNQATPIFRSNDGISWTTNGYYIPYGSGPFDATPYDMTSIFIAALSLNSVAYGNGVFVAVGQEIVTSTDTYVWRSTYKFPTVGWNNATLVNELYGVTYVVNTTFTGFVAVGKGQTYDTSSGLAEIIDVGIILTSRDGSFWNDVVYVSNKGFYGVTSDSTKIVAVGEDGIIYYSLNGNAWFGINQTNVIGINSSDNTINVGNTIGFNIDDPIRFNNDFSSVSINTTYYIHTIVSDTQVKIKTSLVNPVLSLTLGTVPSNTYMDKYPLTNTLRDIIFANNFYIAVGDNGRIRSSLDGFTWVNEVSGTTENLNGITYKVVATGYYLDLDGFPVDSYMSTENDLVMTTETTGAGLPNQVLFTVVGDNNTIIESIDNGITWTSTSLFEVPVTLYDVQGEAFTQGYGPEELVSGVVKDNLSMVVTTKPGSNWPANQYANVGYNVVSLELTPLTAFQRVYSFKDTVQYPAQISLFVIDRDTNLCTGLLPSQYTINWVDETVTLNLALPFFPIPSRLRIDVYEVGNGNQLVRSSTKTDPIILNSVTGWQEIFLNCNYSADLFNGSGVIRPTEIVTDVIATRTTSSNDSIFVSDASKFIINGVIYFQGTTFGNIQEDIPYYVKTISTLTNSITVSDSYNISTGVAGAIFNLIDATGSMGVVINSGSSAVWSDPDVLHNGIKLALGVIGNIFRTKASTNTITTNSTAGLIENSPIKFANYSFGVLVPQQIYYVKNIIDNNEFTLSASVVGGIAGPVLALTDATGSSTFITSDFAFTQGPNGEGTNLVFSRNDYDTIYDYITYTVFGESEPIQYGYTIPEVQVLTATGGQSIYSLENFVGGLNPTNAVVEINGVRQLISQYSISGPNQNITFFNPPNNGDIITITSYSNTDRQYLNTQFGITGSPLISFTGLIVEATVHDTFTYDESQTAGTFEIGKKYQIVFINDNDWPVSGPNTDFGLIGATTVNVGSLVIGTTYVIQYLGTTDFTALGAQTNTFGESFTAIGTGLFTAGNFIIGLPYTIVSPGTTDFTLIGAADNIPGTVFTCTGVGTGDGTASQGDGYTWEKSFTATGAGSDTGSAAIDGDGFDSNLVEMGSLVYDTSYTIFDLGTTTNTQWNIIAGTSNIPSSSLTASITYEITFVGTTNWNAIGYIGIPTVGGTFTSTGNITGTGTADIVYVVGDTITCVNDGYGFGSGLVYGPGIFDGVINYLRCNSSSTTNDIVVNSPLTFKEPTIDGIIPDITYYVTKIYNSKEFSVSESVGGDEVTLTNDTGTMTSISNTIQVNDIVAINNTLSPPLGTSYADQTLHSTAVMSSSSISGTILSVGSLDSGTITLGMELTGTGILPGTIIISNVGGSGSGSTWTINTAQTVLSTTITGTANIINVDDTIGFITGQTVEFKSPYIEVGTLEVGKVYYIFSLGTTTNVQWNTIANTSGVIYEPGMTFTCDDPGVGFGTGIVLLAEFGGINCLGQVYFVYYKTSTTLVVADENNQIITLDNSTFSPLIKVVTGGVPSIRITTLSPHNFLTNQLVRIDGVDGAVQLNNNTYFVHVISEKVFDIYFTPYNFAATAVNDYVEAVSNYTGGGYVWLDTLFTVSDTATYSTSSINNRIYVKSTDNFILGTPVYFSQPGSYIGDTIIGDLVMGQEYYIKEIFDLDIDIGADALVLGGAYTIKTLGNTDWNLINGTTGVTYKIGTVITAVNTVSFNPSQGTVDSTPSFSISSERNGSTVVLTTDYFVTYVTQWQQTNVDRLWVTINGLRVPSSLLRLNDNNNLSILYRIVAGDEVTIGSMIPNETPNQEIYLLNVNQTNEPSVYRSTRYSKTYVTQTLYPMIDVLFVDDVTRVSTVYTEVTNAPAPVNNVFTIGLVAEKTIIASITVFNNTQDLLLDQDTYSVQIVDGSPMLEILDGSYIDTGDILTITTLEGRTILVNGEIIQFNTIDFANNALVGLSRGSFGTGERVIIPKYSVVYGLLSQEKLPDDQYNLTWNSKVYNTIEGDPLQISNTDAALFLESVS